MNSFIFKKHYELPSQALYVDKTNLKKSLHILEDNASDVQVVKNEQVIDKILFQIQ